MNIQLYYLALFVVPEIFQSLREATSKKGINQLHKETITKQRPSCSLQSKRLYVICEPNPNPVKITISNLGSLPNDKEGKEEREPGIKTVKGTVYIKLKKIMKVIAVATPCTTSNALGICS